MIFKPTIENIVAFGDLLFPRHCVSCGIELQSSEKHLCIFCENELFNGHKITTNFKERIQFPVNDLHFLMKYLKKGKSQKIMNGIKYGGQQKLASYLGTKFTIEEKYDCIIPIPLHPKKLRQRGYNQAEEIAKGINPKIVRGDIIIRTKHTNAFARKKRIERWDEVNNLYKVSEKGLPNNQKILLVDDILTTGATLTACAELLNQFNPSKIDVAVIAVTELA